MTMQSKLSFYIGTHNRDPNTFAELVASAARVSHQSQSAFMADVVERAALAVLRKAAAPARQKKT